METEWHQLSPSGAGISEVSNTCKPTLATRAARSDSQSASIELTYQ